MTLLHDSEIALGDYGSTKLLHCPRCGGDCLHQDAVTIFNRDEDQEQLARIEVVGASAHVAIVPSNGSGNPSSRRQGLTIRFSCEGCGGDQPGDVIELTVAQHKGSTELAWRFSPRN